MIALGIGTFAVLLIASVINWLLGMSTNGADKIEAEKNLIDATYQITYTLGQAVYVAQSTTSLNSFSIGASGLGQLLSNFNGDSISGGNAGKIYTIAIFNRENATSATGVSQSAILPTALFYQTPTLNKSGALYLNLGNSPSSSGLVALNPDASSFLIDRVVSFKVVSVQTAPSSQQVTSAQFEITVRYFLGTTNPGSGAWCPPNDIGAVTGCDASLAHKDITTNFQVGLVNNKFNSDGTSIPQQDSLGRIYLFKMLSPMGLK
jgi:hypothetical protein